MVEAQDEEDEEEHVLEANEASDDELEAEYQEAVALMTIAKQRRAEVDRARQFTRKPQSSEDRKAKLDKLKQKLPCARCGRLGRWKDDNDCPLSIGRKPTSKSPRNPIHFPSPPHCQRTLIITTQTQLTAKRMSRDTTLKPQVCRTTWLMKFIGDLVLVNCCPFEGGDVGQSMHWHTDEGDVSIMVSGSADFGERTTRSEVRRVEVSNKQQTN